MINKKYDIKIKVGEYTNNDGKAKGKYITIGRVIQNKDGHPFTVLDTQYLSMQLNYLANKDQKDSLLCNMYEPREKYLSNAPNLSDSSPYNNLDDEIPF